MILQNPTELQVKKIIHRNVAAVNYPNCRYIDSLNGGIPAKYVKVCDFGINLSLVKITRHGKDFSNSTPNKYDIL